jgi:hypothetical protein
MSIGREKKTLFAVIFLSIVVTGLPYLLGFSIQDSQSKFSGFVMGSEDGNSYIAKMMTGYEGDWLYRSTYTTLPQKGIFIHFPYILLGKLAAPPGIHDQMAALFQIYRALAILVMGIGLYRILSLVLKKTTTRMIGLALGILGGGLGWIFILPGLSKYIDYVPLDFYSPETFGFISAFAFPHNAFARGLMYLGIAEFLRNWMEEGDPTRNWRKWIVPGVYIGIAGVFQPLNAAIGAMVVGISILVTIIRKKTIRLDRRQAILPMVVGGGWAGYIGYLTMTDEFFKGWTSQNIYNSPSEVKYLIAYGICLGIFLLNIGKLRVAITNKYIQVILLWIIVIPIMAYFPNNFQRRLPEGSWVAILALVLFLIEQNPQKTYKREIFGFTALSIISSTVILCITIFGVMKKSPDIFIDNDTYLAYQFLNTVPQKSVVLSSFKTGNEMPAWAPVWSVIGLKPETVNYATVEQDVKTIFQTDTFMGKRSDILNKYKVNYLYIGPSERMLGSWKPDDETSFTDVYHSIKIDIYKVNGCLK